MFTNGEANRDTLLQLVLTRNPLSRITLARFPITTVAKTLPFGTNAPFVGWTFPVSRKIHKRTSNIASKRVEHLHIVMT